MVNRKRVDSVYKMRSKNLFYKYAQLGGSLEQDIEMKRKEIKALESQLASERNEERKQKIQKSIQDAKMSMQNIQEKMKLVLQNVASKAGEAASKLSSGISSITSKLSSGISSAASKLSSGISSVAKKMGITEMYNQYKNERVIRDYYGLKAKIVGQIEMLKRAKLKKDEVCKQYSEKVCNDLVKEKYKSPGQLFVETVGGVPRLYYK